MDDGYRDDANVELIRLLRVLTPRVPALVYNSLAFEADRREAARAGTVSHIVEPGEIERLVDAVVRLSGTA